MSASNTTENDILKVTRLFKAPRERVFAAFTTAESMNQWFGCGGKTTTCTTDFRVGGSYRLVTQNFGAVVLVCTVVVGMLLRRVIGDGTAASFVIVATTVLSLMLLGWRLIARLVA